MRITRRCGLTEFNLEFNIGLAYEDLHFADFIIADITAGLKNCMFAEIAPRTFYPLYGILHI